MDENKIIKICDNCKRASCWCGENECKYSWLGESSFITVKDLLALHPDEEMYCIDKYMQEKYGNPNPFKDITPNNIILSQNFQGYNKYMKLKCQHYCDTEFLVKLDDENDIPEYYVCPRCEGLIWIEGNEEIIEIQE